MNKTSSVWCIFSVVAEALEGVAWSKGAQCLFHYIDDFIFVGPQSTDGCVRDLWAFLQSCNELCVAVAPHKTEGAVTCLIVLGIEIDTCLMELRLPAGKLHCLSALLAQWRGKRTCTIKADQDSVEEYIGNLGVLVRYNFYTCSEDSAWRKERPVSKIHSPCFGSGWIGSTPGIH